MNLGEIEQKAMGGVLHVVNVSVQQIALDDGRRDHLQEGVKD
jgi:hypothetical protein